MTALVLFALLARRDDRADTFIGFLFQTFGPAYTYRVIGRANAWMVRFLDWELDRMEGMR